MTLSENTVLGWAHHHHSLTGDAPVEHRHSLMFEGRLGVDDDPNFTGPLNHPPHHEHFDCGPRCTDPECQVEVAS